MNITKKPTMLMILDGFGIRDDAHGNAIAAAKTPNLDSIFAHYPGTRLDACGLAVGLPQGQMGNSEVGHLNIGAGRIVYQELTKISKSIQDGDFFENPELNRAMDHALANNSALHLLGLLSDGGVHSHITHLFALLDMAKSKGLKKVYVHCFLDGRDVPPQCALTYIEALEAHMKEIGVGQIALVSGRFYAMDRDKRYERLVKAYDAMTLADGIKVATACAAIDDSYARDETDEFVLPASVACSVPNVDPKVLAMIPMMGEGAVGMCGTKNENCIHSETCNMADKCPNSRKSVTVNDNDAMIMFNFRPDRAREITRAFVDPNFDGFERKKICNNLCYVCMTQYDATIPNVTVAFPPQTLCNTLGDYISSLGLKQLRIAETEKYAHVTFFFNGGVEEPRPGEDRILVPSPKVATYDLQPEMSAPEVCAKVIEQIKPDCNAAGSDCNSAGSDCNSAGSDCNSVDSDCNSAGSDCKYDMIILNFANADMVGHTGVFDAAVKAVETLDALVPQIVNAVLSVDGQILLTADHGNADVMLDDDNNVMTAHSLSQVPLIYIGNEPKIGNALLSATDGKLSDIAPTMLTLMGLEIPKEMTGKSLI